MTKLEYIIRKLQKLIKRLKNVQLIKTVSDMGLFT